MHLWSGGYFDLAKIEQFLKVLNTDAVDIGWLTASHGLKLTDEVTANAVKAKEQGKVRFIGVTGHEAIPVIRTIKYDVFDCLLYPYSFGFEKAKEKIIPLAKERDMGMVAIKPFNAGTVLTNLDGLKKLAEQMGIEGLTPPQVNLRFILSQPAVSSTVPGMAKPEWVEENAQASIGQKKISRLELEYLERAARLFPPELGPHYAFLNDWRTQSEG
jgi:predicted aldo/keto reductase-like oxidoreductase